MIIKQYIKDFEKLGFGMFVHFGVYSVNAGGEWAKELCGISDTVYDTCIQQFCPKVRSAVFGLMACGISRMMIGRKMLYMA